MYYQLTMQFGPNDIDKIKKVLDVANDEDVKELKAQEKELGIKFNAETFPWEEEKAQKEPVQEKEPSPKVTWDDLKTAGHSYLEKHGHDALKEVLKKFGSSKLSNVKEEQWAEILGVLNA